MPCLSFFPLRFLINFRYRGSFIFKCKNKNDIFLLDKFKSIKKNEIILNVKSTQISQNPLDYPRRVRRYISFDKFSTKHA